MHSHLYFLEGAVFNDVPKNIHNKKLSKVFGGGPGWQIRSIAECVCLHSHTQCSKMDFFYLNEAKLRRHSCGFFSRGQ